jgi:hypothetical protein
MNHFTRLSAGKEAMPRVMTPDHCMEGTKKHVFDENLEEISGSALECLYHARKNSSLFLPQPCKFFLHFCWLQQKHRVSLNGSLDRIRDIHGAKRFSHLAKGSQSLIKDGWLVLIYSYYCASRESSPSPHFN